MSLDDLSGAWRAIDAAAAPPPLAIVTRSADALRRAVRRRNLLEYAAGVIVAVFYGWSAYRTADPLLRIGDLLIVAAVAFVCWQLARRTTPPAPPAAGTAVEAARALRTDLLRQQRALAAVWRWYLLPFLPGFAVIALARILARADAGWSYAIAMELPGLLAVAAVFILVQRLNRAAARDLARSARDLDAFWG